MAGSWGLHQQLTMLLSWSTTTSAVDHARSKDEYELPAAKSGLRDPISLTV